MVFCGMKGMLLLEHVPLFSAVVLATALLNTFVLQNASLRKYNMYVCVCARAARACRRP